jgi:hypothetical protein
MFTVQITGVIYNNRAVQRNFFMKDFAAYHPANVKNDFVNIHYQFIPRIKACFSKTLKERVKFSHIVPKNVKNQDQLAFLVVVFQLYILWQ